MTIQTIVVSDPTVAYTHFRFEVNTNYAITNGQLRGCVGTDAPDYVSWNFDTGLGNASGYRQIGGVWHMVIETLHVNGSGDVPAANQDCPRGGTHADAPTLGSMDTIIDIGKVSTTATPNYKSCLADGSRTDD